MKSIIRFSSGLFFLLLLMSVSWFYFSYQSFSQSRVKNTQDVIVDIAKGTGSFSLVKDLKAKRVIDNEVYTKIFLHLNKDFQKIKTGRYVIQPGITLTELFEKLVAGEQLEYSFSIIEGNNFKQLLASIELQENLIHSNKELIAEALLIQIDANYPHPEGLFFADTYHFNYGYTDVQLLKRAHMRLLGVLDEEWQQRAKGLPYKSPYEALIMASIIEKETAVASERPKIAGVFIRRLQKNMRLQTDPTVIYGIGDDYEGDIKRIHLKTDTPYNTYTRKGLPPTPIAMVGREAIHAALNPEEGDELYFVAKGDGSHYFSVTLEEHNRAVRKYQLKK